MTPAHETTGGGSGAYGAYGLRLRGLEGAAEVLHRSDPAWPDLHVTLHQGTSPRVQARWHPGDGLLNLHGGGRSEILDDPLRAVLTLPELPDDEAVVHPYLAATAAVVCSWLGREVLHGGVFLVDGRAWVLLGSKESGKSSTLGWLAQQGVPVLSDDLVVLDGEQVLSGPRCVDLREEAAKRLGAGEYLGVLGARERYRLRLPGTVPHRAPLAGFVLPAWDEEVAVRPIVGIAKLESLAAHFTLHAPTRPEMLLRLSAKPVLRWGRPQRWESLDPAATILVDALGG